MLDAIIRLGKGMFELILKDKTINFEGDKLEISLEILNSFEKEFINE